MKPTLHLTPRSGASALLLGAGLLFALPGCNKAEAETSVQAAEAPAAQVTTTEVALTDAPRLLRLSGSLKGDQESALAANANGRVLSTNVEIGQTVKAGDILARLDTRGASLSAAEAAAQAENSKVQTEQALRECERYDSLKDTGAISALEYDRAVAQCKTLPLAAKAAQARVQLARQTVSDGVIRAPFGGVVSSRQVEVGQYVRADSTVVTLVSDALRLELAVPEANVAQVKMDAEVTFRVAAYPDREFKGTVRYVSGALRSATRDMLVEATVDNSDAALKPGMFADVDVTIGEHKLPSVPATALFERDGAQRAFFVKDGRLLERVVAVGPRQGDRVTLLRGAAEGEKVVAANPEKLENGQRVR